MKRPRTTHEQATADDLASGSEESNDTLGTKELVRELARRYGVRFGRIEFTIHDGRPAPRVVVEHRLHEDLGD